MKVINSFRGKYAFLRNFYYSPVIYRKKVWSTVEHLFQAHKTKSSFLREQIRLAASPGVAKRLGRKVKLREDWGKKMAKRVMLRFVYLKFKENIGLREQLIETGDSILIEGNYWHDNIWGDCTCNKCSDITGQNLLGKILMQVRTKFG